MTPEPVVYVVDDDQHVCESLRRLMDEVHLTARVCSRAGDFLAAYEPDRPACLILDVRIPDMGGLQLQKHLAGHGIELPIIMVSAHGDVPMVAEAMRNGAFDFFEKPFRAQPILERVQQALALDARRRARRAERSAIQTRLGKLTDREREVLAGVMAGETNKGMAARLGISSQAVDAHRTRLMEKMEVHTLAGLVRAVCRVEDE